MSQTSVAAGKVLLDGEAIDRTLSRIAHEIIERNDALAEVALVGIPRRGGRTARRLRRLTAERPGTDPPLGRLDTPFSRDDVRVRAGEPPRPPQPIVRSTTLDFPP